MHPIYTGNAKSMNTKRQKKIHRENRDLPYQSVSRSCTHFLDRDKGFITKCRCDRSCACSSELKDDLIKRAVKADRNAYVQGWYVHHAFKHFAFCCQFHQVTSTTHLGIRTRKRWRAIRNKKILDYCTTKCVLFLRHNSEPDYSPM